VKKVLLCGLSIAIGMSACVSKSKHEKQMSELNQELTTTNEAIAKAKAENAALEAERNKIQDNLVATTKDRGQLKASLDEMKKAMEEMRQRQAEQKQRLQEFEDLTKRFKKLTDSGALSVQFIDGKMVVSLGSDVLFPSGSAKLSPSGMIALKEVTAQLKAIPGKRYQIEGHTDNLPIATAAFPSNWELASARALNVTRSMIAAGMPAERVSAASFGDTTPRKSNDTAEGKAANRRIAIVVVPDLSTMPGYEELSKRSQTTP
jgi:chemotaxis protein MotB